MVQKERLDDVFKAKRQIVEGALTIWNERLTALVNAGDLRGALDQMISPAEGWFDNCGCGNNCSCRPGALEISREEGGGGRTSARTPR